MSIDPLSTARTIRAVISSRARPSVRGRVRVPAAGAPRPAAGPGRPPLDPRLDLAATLAKLGRDPRKPPRRQYFLFRRPAEALPPAPIGEGLEHAVLVDR